MNEIAEIANYMNNRNLSWLDRKIEQVRSWWFQWTPTTRPNSIRFRRCTFRRKFYKLRYGGAGGGGMSYEWFGVAIQLHSPIGHWMDQQQPMEEK